MAGQDPFEAIGRESRDRPKQGRVIPDQLPRRFQSLGFQLPPEMVAGEEKPILIEEGGTARRMAWNRNGEELRGETDRLRSLNDPLGIRNGVGILTMDDPLRAEMFGVLAGVRDIVFMRQEDVSKAPVPFKKLCELFDDRGESTSQLPSGCRTKKLFAPNDFSELKPQ